MQTSLLKVLLCSALLFLFALPDARAQDKFTLSGYIKDKAAGEGLISASVLIKELPGKGTSTNEYGYYSITLPAGTYTVVFNYIGYNQTARTVELTGNKKLDIELEEAGTTLQEVEVTTRREDDNVKSTEMSTVRMKMSELKTMPALLGEVDVIKAIQMMPGVQTVGEGTSGFYVRGGGVDQNLVLLDEAPVYNASHLMGFFSVFNSDALKDVQLYKGGIPAQYGGRLSSLLDIRMKEGNAKKFSASGGIGILSSRLTLEAPIVKEKSSFMLSARRTYADMFLIFAKDKNLRDNKLYFYDFNAKVNYTLNENNRLFLSGYFGRDVAKAGTFGFDWGNATGTVRWNHLFSDRLFTNTTLIFSDFDYSLGSTDSRSEFKWTSHIKDYSIKHDYTFFLNPENQVKFGAIGILHKFLPGRVVPGPESYFVEQRLDGTNGLEGAVYVSNLQKLSPRLTSEYGLRYSVFSNVGRGKINLYAPGQPILEENKIGTQQFGSYENIKAYGGFEPRLAFTYQLNEVSSLKTSYNRMRQYIHLISNTTASLPFDVWTPSGKYIKPGIADQVAAGYFRNLHDNMFETSVEVYYKHLQNQVDYKDNANTFLNDHIETELLSGKGKAYGAEFMVRKQKGALTGWVSYTLAKTDRTVPGINNGNAYPTRYDRRHNVNIVAAYDISKKWNLGANWVYVTGGAVTMPVGKFEYQGLTYPLYSERNGYRLPAYHRLDLSATYEKPQSDKKRYYSSWTFSVYNAYARHNPFSIYFREKRERNPDTGTVVATGQTEAVKTYMFGIIPSVTYNFNF